MLEAFVEFVKAAGQFGTEPVLLCGFLVMFGYTSWQNHKREQVLQSRVDQLTELQHKQLTECTSAVASCKTVIQQNSDILMSLIGGVRTK